MLRLAPCLDAHLQEEHSLNSGAPPISALTIQIAGATCNQPITTVACCLCYCTLAAMAFLCHTLFSEGPVGI